MLMNEISIDKLRLSTRSTNALKCAGVFTLEQLISLNVDDLYNIGNIGKKSVGEICSLVERINNGEIIITEYTYLNGTITPKDEDDG